MPKIQVMSPRGDDLLAEWGMETEFADLENISKRFRELRAKGYSAFTTASATRIDAFTPEIQEDIILIAPLIGG